MLLGLAAAPCLPSRPAQAQWVFLARKVIGRVEQMTQPADKEASKPGYDMASVILDARASRVYATVLAGLRKHPTLKIAREDAAHRRVEFSDGAQSASITVVSLGENLSQLLVGSSLRPGEPSATSRVMDGVMTVCREMRKTCTVAQ